MPWKYHPVLAKMRRIARLRHKFRSSLRQRGWAKTLHRGWKKVRRRLCGDSSSPYRQWQKENRRRRPGRDAPPRLEEGPASPGMGLVGRLSELDCRKPPAIGRSPRQRRWAKNTEGLPRILLLITTAGCSRKTSRGQSAACGGRLTALDSNPCQVVVLRGIASTGFRRLAVRLRGGDESRRHALAGCPLRVRADRAQSPRRSASPDLL